MLHDQQCRDEVDDTRSVLVFQRVTGHQDRNVPMARQSRLIVGETRPIDRYLSTPTVRTLPSWLSSDTVASHELHHLGRFKANGPAKPDAG